MAPHPSEKAARACLQEVNKLCHSIELTLNNGDPFAKRATDTLELHKVELLSSRLSLEEVKKKLQVEIELKTLDNTPVAADMIWLNEQLSTALSRSMRVLVNCGYTFESVNSASRQMSSSSSSSSYKTAAAGATNNSKSSSSNTSGGGSDVSSAMIGIMRKLRMGARNDILDAVAMLWKLLDTNVEQQHHSVALDSMKVRANDSSDVTSMGKLNISMSVNREVSYASDVDVTLPADLEGNRSAMFMPSLECYISEEGGSPIQCLSTKLLVVRDIRHAGALQMLMLALQRSQREGWIDVETSIAKILSVLVAYEEEDSQLLLNNALDILHTLHTSLVSTTDRDVGKRSRANSLVTMDSTRSEYPGDILGATGDISAQLGGIASSTDPPRLGRMDSNESGDMMNPPTLQRGRTNSDDFGRDEREEEDNREVRSTAALALNRLCAVLSEGWLKQGREEKEASDLNFNLSPSASTNDKSASALEAAFGPTLSGSALSRQNSLPGQLVGDKAGSSLARTNSVGSIGTSVSGNPGRRRSRSNVKPVVIDALADPSMTMELIMRLMLAVSGTTINGGGDLVSSAVSYAGTLNHSNPPSAPSSRPGSVKLPSNLNLSATMSMSSTAGENYISPRASADFSMVMGAPAPLKENDGATRLPVPNIIPGQVLNGGIAFDRASLGGTTERTNSGTRLGTTSRGGRESSGSGGGGGVGGGGGGDAEVMSIEPASIICCEALVALSSIPQCRTVLVSGNVALPLLRRWLDISASLLSAELSWRIDMGIEGSDNKNTHLRLAQVMVSRISSALINLMGGDGYADPFVSSPAIPGDDGVMSSSDSSSNASSGLPTGQDMTGWIDTQLVSQGIATNIIRLVDASIEDFTAPSSNGASPWGASDGGATAGTDESVEGLGVDTDGGNLRAIRRPVSLLSRAVQIRLASILQQLCSRHVPQRRQLFSLGAPYTFCSLFVHAVKTFQYHIVQSQVSPRESRSSSRVRRDSDADVHGGDPDADPERYSEEENLSYFLAIASPCLDSLASFTVDTTSNFVPPNPSGLADSSRLGGSVSQLGQTGTAAPEALDATAMRGDKEKEEEEAKTPPLIRWMSSEGFVESLKLGMSLLPQCRARLACLHVVSSLTEWPLSLRALFEGNVTDTLVHISYEDTDAAAGGNSSDTPGGMQYQASDSSDMYLSSTGSSLSMSANQSEFGSTAGSVVVSPRSARMTPFDGLPLAQGVLSGASSNNALGNSAHMMPPLAPVLDTSNLQGGSLPEATPASDLMSLLSGIGLTRQSQQTQSETQTQGQGAPLSSRPSQEQVEQEKKDPRAFTVRNVREETMTVCLALANLCQHNSVFALRVYKNGLLSIMLRHASSPHVEVKRQALRCISAMCEILPDAVAATVHEGDVAAHSQGEIQETLSVLTGVLTDVDDFSLSMLQKEAMLGIARLANTQDENVLDFVFEGPLRSICSLMIDPNNEKDVRMAAEQVLISCGFPGGAADFQMCANDFQSFLDWFTLRRSLNPQRTGQVLVERWIEAIFATHSHRNTASNTFLALSSPSSSNALASTHGSDGSLTGLMVSPGAAFVSSAQTPERRSPIAGDGMVGAEGSRERSSTASNSTAVGDDVMDRSVADGAAGGETATTDGDNHGPMFGMRRSIKKLARKSLEKVGSMFHNPDPSAETAESDIESGMLALSIPGRTPSFEAELAGPVISGNTASLGAPESGLIAKLLPFCVGGRMSGTELDGETGLLPVYRNPSLTPGRTGASSPTTSQLTKFLGSAPETAGAGIPELVAGYFTAVGSKSSLDPDYAGLDAPPFVVWELLEHFFPSKLHKLLVLDLVSLGCWEEVNVGQMYVGGDQGWDRNNASPRTRDRYSLTKSRGSATAISAIGKVRKADIDNRERTRTISSIAVGSAKSGVSRGEGADGKSIDSNAVGAPTDISRLPTAQVVSGDSENEEKDDRTDIDSDGEGSNDDDDLSDLDFDDDLADFASTTTGGGAGEPAVALASPTWVNQPVIQHYLPQPHQLYALMMPSRNYHHHNIEIMCRVVERMVSDGDRSRIWALVFKNCLFASDFHETFLAALRRTPQIVALTFRVDPAQAHTYNTKENVGSLGYLGGMLPPSIRWLSFCGSLTKDSLQILCILLLRNNAAFSGPAGGADDDEEHDDDDDFWHEDEEDGTERRKQHPHHRNLRWRRSRGLVGLSVTNCNYVDGPQVNYLCSLLSFTGLPNSPTAAGPGATPRTPHRNSGHRHNNHHNHHHHEDSTYHGRGLKLVDLSFNQLSDSKCAELLAAACRGPVEDLDLGGNLIRKGAEFVESFNTLFAVAGATSGSGAATPTASSTSAAGEEQDSISKGLKLTNPDVDTRPNPTDALTPPGSRLRHLGLGFNQLTQSCLLSLLRSLCDNTTLTSLDLTGNDIHGCDAVNEGLRELLIRNSGLRSLDLSMNRLTPDTAEALHLGLLENDSLLILNLSGNPQTASPNLFDFQQIQSKLKSNRDEYKYTVVLARRQIKDLKRRLARYRDQVREGNLLKKNGEGGVGNVEAIAVAIPANDASAQIPEAEVVSPTSKKQSPPQEKHQGEDDGQDEAWQEDDSPRSRTRSAPVLRNQRVGMPIDYMYKNIMREDTRLVAGQPMQRRGSDNGTGGTRASGFHNAIAGRLDDVAPPLHPATEGTSSSSAATAATGVKAGNSAQGKDAPGRTALNRSANISLVADLEEEDFEPTGLEDGMVNNANKRVAGTLAVQSSAASVASTDTNAYSTVSTVPDVLNVLFSAPLAWRDKSNRLHPLERLDYASERDALSAVFKEVRRDVSLCFDFATTDSMRTALSCGCRALHFSGHGHPQSLNFEDGRAGLQVVTTERLKKLLMAGSSDNQLALDFVFVAACYSKQTGEVFIECGVKHVVAVKVDAMIQDSAAKAFTRAFYVALLSGKTVQQAFDIAREALKASPYVPDSVLEGEKFVLLPEPKEREPPLHDEAIFTGRPIPSWPSVGQCVYGTQSAVGMSPELADHVQLSSCLARYPPPPPLDYEGREVDMHRCITSIIAPTRRLVTLAGEEGLGKSALAAAVCCYLADRRLPTTADGILYVRCEELTSHLSLLEKLKSELLNSAALLPSLKKRLRAFMEAAAVAGLSDDDFEHYNPDVGDMEQLGMGATEDNTHDEFAPPSEVEQCYRLEEAIIGCVSSIPLRMLIVLDNIDGLVSEQSYSTDLKLFIGRLFERTPQLKVFITASNPLCPEGFGVVEYTVPLGPLTLRNSLRLYARLAPPLVTAASKQAFVSLLTPQNQSHVTITSTNLSVTAVRILQALGNGYTTQVIKLACSSTQDKVADLLLLAGHKGEVIKRVLSHYFLRDADITNPSPNTATSAPSAAGPPPPPGRMGAAPQPTPSGSALLATLKSSPLKPSHSESQLSSRGSPARGAVAGIDKSHPLNSLSAPSSAKNTPTNTTRAVPAFPQGLHHSISSPGLAFSPTVVSSNDDGDGGSSSSETTEDTVLS
jgi:hypothetical protein